MLRTLEVFSLNPFQIREPGRPANYGSPSLFGLVSIPSKSGNLVDRFH